jgi:hypothetical protein
MARRIRERNSQFNKRLAGAFNRFIAHQADNLGKVVYDNHEMVIAMGLSNIIVGIAVCVLTGEVTILYVIASIVANTLLDIGVSFLSSLIMRAISERLGKEVKHGPQVDIQLIPQSI